MSATPPANWYPDPSGSPRLRYWDGQQWTNHFHPPLEQRAASVAPIAEQPRTKRPRRTLAIVAGSVVAVLGITSFFVWGLPAIQRGGNPLLSNPEPEAGAAFAYTDPMLGLERTHEFTFPADYDLDVLAEEYTPEPTPLEIEEGWEPILATDYGFDVFFDAALTKRAEFGLLQYDPGEPIHIYGRDANEANDPDNNYVPIKTEYEGWGLHTEYYLVRKVDEKGELLETPIVTRFTVESALDAPVVTFSTPGNDGNLTLEWEPVAGATSYTIVTSEANPAERSGRYYDVLATTDATEWSSATIADESDNAPWFFTQNAEMRLFSSSADEIEAGWSLGNRVQEYDIGVIANDGIDYSPYVPYDAIEVAGSLPYEIAGNASRKQRQWGASGYIEGIENVQKSVFFTSLDGATRSTTAYIDIENILDYDDRWILPLRGRGTNLGEWIPITKASVSDVVTAAEQFNSAAAAAAPTTGMPTFATVSVPTDSNAPGEATAPDTDYPLYGSSDYVQFLGQHMIAQTPIIDLTDWIERPGIADTMDAAYEAMYQNPFVMNVKGLAVNLDGTKLHLTYAYSIEETRQLQAAVDERITEVVSSVTSESMGAADKVTALNDWIAANAEYDYTALAASDEPFVVGVPEDYEYAWNTHGILVQGLGVCASYAYAFNALANAASVETVVVTGEIAASANGHAWNKVKIDGQWLAVDPTWNDSSAPNQYLMISDSQFTDSALRTENTDWIVDLEIASFATP